MPLQSGHSSSTITVFNFLIQIFPSLIHLPAAILVLPSLVSRRPPNNSSMYPSSISRFLFSIGIRCIKPLAPSRNEANSPRVRGGQPNPGPFLTIRLRPELTATINLTHYQAFHLEV